MKCLTYLTNANYCKPTIRSALLAILLAWLGCCSTALALPKVADPKLQACIDESAKKFNWQHINDVTTLKCHKHGIRSIEGLAQFTQLRFLSLFNNHLSRFDGTAFTELTTLNLARNQLTDINIGPLSKLQKLYVFDNPAEQLHLESLPALTLLRANNGKLKQLTYKSLPQLEKAYIFDNDLETIDMVRLVALKYMDTRQNPMPDELYNKMDTLKGITILHDGNAEDW